PPARLRRLRQTQRQRSGLEGYSRSIWPCLSSNECDSRQAIVTDLTVARTLVRRRDDTIWCSVRRVNAHGCHCLVAYAEVKSQAMLSSLEDGALTAALPTRLLQRVAHDGFAMPASPVRRKRGDVIHADRTCGNHGRRSRHRFAVRVPHIAHK